ncbi:FecCD family ABC transporter permease [Cohnella faecalis]|uniref:FecCD family ABC transporter permease n=1 Tax=Cohnella faecalis TaxID=2315694 RepID=UPI0036081FC7
MKLRTVRLKTSGAAACLALLLLAMGSSVLLGAANYELQEGWAAIFHYDGTTQAEIIIRTTRVPRALMAAAVGASLAVAGALMQALTRNPLASPGVLGINAGATFFIVTASLVFSVSSMQAQMWISFAGAAASAVIVYSLGSLGKGGTGPLKIILAGSAVTALFASFTQGMLVMNKQGLNSVLFWLTGSIAGRPIELLASVWPYMIVGLLASCLLAKDMNVIAMGEAFAKGLGQRTSAVKVAAALIVVALAGASVSVAGPIGFIGIVAPHAARFLVGRDHRWAIPYSAMIGAVLLVAADLASRYLIEPEEIPVGVMTAILGGPFFVYIARRELTRL